MNTWKVILATLVIWAAGVVTGGMIVNYYGWPVGQRTRPRSPAPPSWMAQGRDFVRRGEKDLQLSFDERRGAFLLHATRELQLTPEQHAHIEKIIRDSQDSSRKVWEQVAPQLRDCMADAKAKILAELSPEQRTRFEELLKQSPRPRRPAGSRGSQPQKSAAKPANPPDQARGNPMQTDLPGGNNALPTVPATTQSNP